MFNTPSTGLLLCFTSTESISSLNCLSLTSRTRVSPVLNCCRGMLAVVEQLLDPARQGNPFTACIWGCKVCNSAGETAEPRSQLGMVRNVQSHRTRAIKAGSGAGWDREHRSPSGQGFCEPISDCPLAMQLAAARQPRNNLEITWPHCRVRARAVRGSGRDLRGVQHLQLWMSVKIQSFSSSSILGETSTLCS